MCRKRVGDVGVVAIEEESFHDSRTGRHAVSTGRKACSEGDQSDRDAGSVTIAEETLAARL